MQIGYKLSSEEHGPNELVHQARRAEECGFSFAMISDHFHPWTDRQGQSPFVWSVIGAISQVTKELHIGTGVTCPTTRIHPAIIAQAAATAACMLPGRFILGVGTGELLNEHILADYWPPADVRREMLEEAVDIMRLLWQGGSHSYEGRFYTVENARIYTLPEQPPNVLVAAAGQHSAELAGRIGDGLAGTAPKRDLIKTFESSGGKGKPRYGEMTVCWARSEEEAVRTVMEIWPNAGIPGELSQELPMPAHFEQASRLVREEDVRGDVACGPSPEKHLEKLRKYVEAGYDHVWVHQVGPDQEGFFRFYEREIIPGVRELEPLAQ